METWLHWTHYARNGGQKSSGLRRGAHSLRVFGSVARGEANENSDLDLLVAWEPGRSLLDHSRLVQDLQELLGIKVHVAPRNRCTGTCATECLARRRRCEGRSAYPYHCWSGATE
jgi:predicted nucleotidyltransferase